MKLAIALSSALIAVTLIGATVYSRTSGRALASLITEATIYPDQEMVEFNPKIKARYLKMRSLLESNQKCLVGLDGFMSSYYRREVADRYLPNDVVCIQDIVVNAGTLKETSGCSLVKYNLDSDQYGNYFNRYFAQAMASKTCEQGGFQELLGMRGWWSGDAWQNSTVEEAIFTPKKFDEPWQFVLVYAKNNEFSKWFSAARTKGAVFVTKKLAEKKDAAKGSE